MVHVQSSRQQLRPSIYSTGQTQPARMDPIALAYLRLRDLFTQLGSLKRSNHTRPDKPETAEQHS